MSSSFVVSNPGNGISTSTHSISPTWRYRRSQLALPRLSCSMHILRESWTKEIQEPEVKSNYQYVLNLWQQQIALEELHKAQTGQKLYYDCVVRRRNFA
ncbi:hypothetical protein PoB_006371600 [Plakobranchus ocellatus]|uniref:Uncharacterized protein n=1 Tax=Plakobranchus ocellatus TaxID=259542 RepID=A0AAV4CZ38_9GAST|nr:hypothetical protein PoB_006371600 [Plakobranchus ocellatus]